MSRGSVGPVRSLLQRPDTRVSPRGPFDAPEERDGQEACERVDMLISSRVQAFLGIPWRGAPIRRRGESDKVATCAVCPDQATHLAPNAVPIGPTSPRPGKTPGAVVPSAPTFDDQGTTPLPSRSNCSRGWCERTASIVADSNGRDPARTPSRRLRPRSGRVRRSRTHANHRCCRGCRRGRGNAPAAPSPR